MAGKRGRPRKWQYIERYTLAERLAIDKFLREMGDTVKSALASVEAEVPPQLQDWNTGMQKHWYKVLTVILWFQSQVHEKKRIPIEPPTEGNGCRQSQS